MRFLSILFVVIGSVIVGFAGNGIVHSKMKTSESLEEAKKMITNFSDEKVDKKKERFQPPSGETVGILEIPKLKVELPIIEGTDVEDLEKGVGHYKGSYYPEENGQIILSGHRDTVFRGVGDLKIGDELIIGLPYGQFTYEITNTKIVDKNDLSIITLHNNHEELILTTCYPFHYIGSAPERYIIYAKGTVR